MTKVPFKQSYTTTIFCFSLINVIKILILFSLLSLLWKNKSSLVQSPYSLCVSCLCVPHYQLLNAWTNLYETWYLYHGTWAYLNGVLHKSLPSVCMYIWYPTTVAGQRLGKKCYRGNEYTRNNRRLVRRVVFYAVHVVSKESRRLVLPRTSCLICSSPVPIG
jgi:hypothetical protein